MRRASIGSVRFWFILVIFRELSPTPAFPPHHAEGAAARRERGRPDGRAAQERRRRSGRDQGPEEVGQEAAEGGGRPEGNADADRRQEAEGSGREEAGGQVAAEVGVGAPNFRSIRQQRCLEVASRPAMSPWSMGRVGLIDITVGNAARLGASQRSTTRRCASHHIATQRASRWGHPGGSRAFSAAQRQLSPTCLNPCLVPDDCFCRYQT
jgi:hypothetical protein